ncbi:Hypothetical protein Minf_1556 [Methylacidiphilum infernorum V4]|uniref:Uncharacterized protein n=1 Tax=Methylacidiphilum infernorum (isolate V4) TaxID=481448 RepID=B3DWA7_METI4|nr:Hypothetical protein Minf_1556 [Methylacidiphilum infernorum V4]
MNAFFLSETFSCHSLKKKQKSDVLIRYSCDESRSARRFFFLFWNHLQEDS